MSDMPTREEDDDLQNSEDLSEEDLSEEDDEEEEDPWVSWFCSLRGNEFFCEVDEDYIRDNFNLTGLGAMVPHYELALDIILDENVEMSKIPRQKQLEIEQSAAMLYGLIHARFIITGAGLHRMMEKYNHTEFGCCPRISCEGQQVLPIGISDTPGHSGTTIFCPMCHEVYVPKSAKQGAVDGAFFGTTFAHLFLLVYPQFIPKCIDSPSKHYVPRIFGYRINKDSPYYQNRKDLVPSHDFAVGSSAVAPLKPPSKEL